MSGPGECWWRRAPGVAWTGDDDRYAVLDLDRPEQPPIVLTGLASVAWGALRRPLVEAGVIEYAAARLMVDPVEVGPHVRDTLAALERAALAESTGQRVGSAVDR